VSEAPIKKMALLRLGPIALRELFQLPAGAEVVRVEADHGYRGGVRVVIEGAGWDTMRAFVASKLGDEVEIP
jgi:hypothetical protein